MVQFIAPQNSHKTMNRLVFTVRVMAPVCLSRISMTVSTDVFFWCQSQALVDHATSKSEDNGDAVTPLTSELSATGKQKLVLPSGITPLHAAASIGMISNYCLTE